jgi:hypothetical protein
MEYKILNNGGYSFKVKTEDDKVLIYNYSTNELVYTAHHVKKVFMGNSPLCKMTEYSGGFGEEYDGNSVILHMDHDTYIYVGSSIFSFVSYNKIKKYVSPVGNSAVPYPYAIDKYNYYYLMLEDIVMKIPTQYKDDPYDYYYSICEIDKMDDNIQKAYINNKEWIEENGGNRVILRYAQFAEKDYERLENMFTDDLDFGIIYKDGTNMKFTKESYVEFMEDYAAENEIMRLTDKIEIYNI